MWQEPCGDGGSAPAIEDWHLLRLNRGSHLGISSSRTQNIDSNDNFAATLERPNPVNLFIRRQ